METGNPTAAQKQTFRCSCLHPHQELRTQDRERGKMGCYSQKTVVLPSLALTTMSSPSSSSHLGRRPKGRQQPRWIAPAPAAGRGADNGGGHSLQRHTHIHTRTYTRSLGAAGCHMGWQDSLRRQQLPSCSLRCSTPSPSPSPDGKQIRRKTPARHWAVQEREGFVLHASQQPHHAPHRKKSLLAYNSCPPKTLFYLQLAHSVLGLV